MWNKFTLNEIEHSSSVIMWNNQKKRFVLDDQEFKNCNLNIDTPSPELLEYILEKVGSQAKKASQIEVPFDKIIPSMSNWWHASSKEGLKVPIGLGAQQIQYLEFGKEKGPHGLIAGTTGFGKSNLFHVLITASCLIYSPQELELYLIDLKDGIEFKTYATHELPHARVLAIESDREFALSVLKGVNDEFTRRADLFKNAERKNISGYREKTNKTLPRIILLVDEYQKLFLIENDDITIQALQILDNLARQGLSYGIHVLLSSQSLNGNSTLLTSTIGQMKTRIAFKCSDTESRTILAGDNDAAASLSRRGEAIYNDDSGAVNKNKLFQVALLQEDKQNDYLQKILDKAKKQKFIPPNPQIVFESKALSEITKNCILHDLLIAFPHISTSNEKRIWLGESISIKDPTTVCFKREGKNNLVIVGNNDKAVAGMVFSSIIAFASQSNPKDINLCIVDLSDTDCSNFFARLSDIIPHPVRVAGIHDLPDILNEMSRMVSDRLERGFGVNDSSLYLIIFGLQKARILKQDDSYAYDTFIDDAAAQVNPTRQLATILAEGPNLGVHTLVWCDSYTNLTNRIGERLIKEFDMRVALQMSPRDSSDLIHSTDANMLGPYRALYLSENEGKLEKFKPYGLPKEEWLTFVKNNFKHNRK